MDNATIGACPEGGDSPLSWAGNIVGLLTFTLGVFATFTAILAATGNAEQEIEANKKLIKQTRSHLNRINDSVNGLLKDADRDYGSLKLVIDGAVDAYDKAVNDTDKYMKENFPNPKHCWTHVKWWYMEKETAARFANLQSCSEHLTAAQLTFVQRRVVQHTYELHLIQSTLGQSLCSRHLTERYKIVYIVVHYPS
ncbi:hypothetical protein BR93DRAFT_978361, partial [Coniochaeta sp. PMI_546]